MNLISDFNLGLDFFLTVGAASLFALAYILSQIKPKNYPPGPWGFPILGHLPRLGKEPYKVAAAWKAKYGPIVSLNFGSYPCIIISDYKLAREAYAMPEFCARPKMEFASRRSGGQPEGIIFTSGAVSREQRTFTLKRLRQLGGFGTKSMQSVILEQAQEMIEGLSSKPEVVSGAPLDTHHTLSIAFFNTLWALIAGEPFKQTDPTILKFTRIVVEAVGETDVFTMLSLLIPWFGKYFPLWLTRDDGLDRMFNSAGDLFQPYIEEHWRTRVSGQPRDFIDAYIDQIEITTDPESSFHGSRGKYGLMCTLLDLFIAGIETTGTTFKWLCLLLATYPEVQEHLVADIQAKIGGTRLPSLNDRGQMAYVEAVIHEVMRFKTLLGIGVMHSTSELVHFHGYYIPKDTMVYINIHEAHFNKELWGDPEAFRPERWLSPAGDFVPKREGFLPFSTGKRICIGEQLARDQLFLFTIILFRAVRIGLDPNSPPPSLEPKLGSSTLLPKPHKLVFKLRKQ